MSHISNNIMRWGLAIIVTIILSIGLLYVCGLIFSNSDTSVKLLTPKAKKHSFRIVAANTHEHSLSYQKTLDRYEHSKQLLENKITPPQDEETNTPPPFHIHQKHTNSVRKDKPSLPTNIFSSIAYTPPQPIQIISSTPSHQHVIRIPPIMPPKAQKSGHCKLRFDVGKDGKIHNIQALSCTQDIFKQPSITAVAKWRYPTKVKNGLAIERKHIETILQYKLLDERGNIIPE